MMDKKDRMDGVSQAVIGLSDSPLFAYRVTNKNLPVIGEGSLDARLMFVGEAPGKNEALSGKPFCGRSGKVLDNLLNAIGMQRDEVYITNIVKDRPPLNRDPNMEEVLLYSAFLDKQIDIIQPKVIASLGRISMDYLMKKYGLSDSLEPIGKLHGTVFEIETSYGKACLVPMYHPAVAVYNSNKFGVLKTDFEILKNAI